MRALLAQGAGQIEALLKVAAIGPGAMDSDVTIPYPGVNPPYPGRHFIGRLIGDVAAASGGATLGYFGGGKLLDAFEQSDTMKNLTPKQRMGLAGAGAAVGAGGLTILNKIIQDIRKKSVLEGVALDEERRAKKLRGEL